MNKPIMSVYLIASLTLCAAISAHAEIRSESTLSSIAWMLETSPIGDVAKRPNLELTYFFTQQFAVSALGTRMSNAGQFPFESENGFEIGARAFYYPDIIRSQTVKLGGHVGLYYANFTRGDDIGDALSYAFQETTFDREVVNGPMLEMAIGPLFRWNSWLTTEATGGVQTYRVSYVRYNSADGSSTDSAPSQWKVYPELELNVGFAF